MISKKIKLSILASSFLLSCAFSNEVHSLKEVTVTAQKTIEDVQKVPVAISVYDDISLEDKNINTLEDIAKYTPNLLLFNSGQQGLVVPSLRGISADVLTFSTPLSLYLDGVPVLSSFGFTDNLEDIQRVEVLRGPQGTLYGKNSQVGVINVISKKPDNDFRAKLYSDIGNNGKKNIGLNVSTPIIEDKLYASFLYKHFEKDGFIKHTTRDKYVNTKKNTYGKAKLRFTPSDNLELILSASRLKIDNGAHDWASSEKRVTNSNIEEYSKPSTNNYALSVNYNINENNKLSSVTTKRIHKDVAFVDADRMPFTIRHIKKQNSYDSVSQEFKYESKFDNFTILSGVYLDKEDNKLDTKMFTMMDPFANNSKEQKLDNKSIGVFTNLKYKLSNKLTLNTGIRYDKEKKQMSVDGTNIDLDDTWTNISPKLSLQYDLSKDSILYTTIAKGYRSGGFNPFAPANKQSYEQEELLSYELGYKGKFFDNKLKFNANAFYMDIDDMQVSESPSFGLIYMVNAATAKSKGLELELEALLNKEFSLLASAGYNKTTFDKFEDNLGNYSGNYNPFAPKYNYSLALQYRNDFGYFARLAVNGYGKTYFDKQNKYSNSAYSLVDMKLGYEHEAYDVYLYVNNLFDTNHDMKDAYFNGTTSILNDDRQIGFKIAYRF